MIAGGIAAHALADGGHDTRSLVAQHERQGIGDRAVGRRQVAVAHAACGEPNHDLATARRQHLDLLDRDGRAQFARHDGFRSLIHCAAAPARQSDGDWPVQRRNARVKLLPEEKPSKTVISLTL